MHHICESNHPTIIEQSSPGKAAARMSCNVCMDGEAEDDIENPLCLLSCGNKGCTFQMCTTCAETYYGNKYGNRQCPHCRASPVSDAVRSLIPERPVIPGGARFPGTCDHAPCSLLIVYFGGLTLLAWFVGATICGVIYTSCTNGGTTDGGDNLIQIVVGYAWLMGLVILMLTLRYICIQTFGWTPQRVADN